MRIRLHAFAFGIAITAQDFGIALRFGHQFDHLTVGNGAATLALLLAAGTDQFRLGQTFGLHAVASPLSGLGSVASAIEGSSSSGPSWASTGAASPSASSGWLWSKAGYGERTRTRVVKL